MMLLNASNQADLGGVYVHWERTGTRQEARCVCRVGVRVRV